MTGRFRGQGAVVVGATGGLGQAISHALAAEGARLLLVGRDRQRLEGVRNRISNAGWRVPLCREVDVCMPARLQRTVARAAEEVGPVRVVVNAAGVPSVCPAAALGPEEWGTVLGTNLTATLALCQGAAAAMAPNRQGGSIVLLSSIHAQRTYPQRAAYAASKAGVEGLVRALAVEWGPRGIRVNAVSPGQVRTPLVERLVAEGKLALEAVRVRTPLLRIAEPADIVGPVLFLCSEESRHITGQRLVVDGGYTVNAWPEALPVPVRTAMAVGTGSEPVGADEGEDQGEENGDGDHWG